MPKQHTPTYTEAERSLASTDPVMKLLIEQHGPGLVRTMPHGFASMTRIIVGQQLSTIVAARIYERLQELTRGKITPGEIAKLTDSQLRSVGLSQAKTNSVRDLAAKVSGRVVSFKRIESMCDDDVSEHLVQVKGIGPWSAQMYLMFVLGRSDIFAAGDKGIQTAVMRLYGKRNLQRLDKFAVRWKPYRTVACLYLWRSLANEPVAKAT
ncbi:MAG: DNA-3-methyladenine glycosylase 2 family protein [bacterium]|nr:DNA-3-methyladenine glycosylase 2 family protein [bacterium]